MVDKHIGFDLVVDEFKVRCSKQFEVFEFDPTLATSYYITFKWVSMHYLCNGQFNLSFWHWVENNLWPHTWFFSKFFHIAPIFSNVPITFKNLNFSNNWLLVYVVFFVCKNSFWESFYRSSFHKFFWRNKTVWVSSL